MSERKRLPRTPVRSAPANGAAAKWKPGEFESIVSALPAAFAQEGVQGLAQGEDCSIVRINDDQATVFALDWFPPVVDDLYRFGAISAASALSRLYAAGVKPVVALNIMALPCKWGVDAVGQVVRGGSDKVAEAGAFVVGGHSIDDAVPKYGLAVFGMGHPRDIADCANIVPGDVLFYTKPLGLGVATEAYRTGALSEEGYQPAVECMCELGRGVFEAYAGLQVHGAGFVAERGLVGHLHDMLELCQASAELQWGSIPLLDGVWDLCCQGLASERTKENARWAAAFVDDAGDVQGADARLALLGDAATGGGLLVAVAPDDADAFACACEQGTGRAPSRIGEVHAGSPGRIAIHS